MARRFIIEAIPNKAPQKAYILHPAGGKEKSTHLFIYLFMFSVRLVNTSPLNIVPPSTDSN